MKIDKLSLLTDSVRIFSSSLIVNIISIFYFILITHLFTKIELASLSILTVLTGLGSMFSGLGVMTSLVKEIPRLLVSGEREEVSSMIKSVLVVHFVVTIVCVFICIIFSKRISKVFFKSEDYAFLVCVSCFNILTYKLLDDGQQILTALQDFKQYSIVRFYEGVVVKIIALVGYLLGGIVGYIGIIVISNLFIFIYILYIKQKLICIKSRIFPIKKLVVNSLPFYGNAYTNFFAGQGDQFIIATFLSPEILAGYYVARRFYDYLSMVIDAITRPINMKIAELKSYGIEKIRNVVFKSSKYLSIIMVPISFFVAVSCYPLLQIYGGGKYINSASVLVILALTAIPSVFYSLTLFCVYVIGKPVETFKIELIRALTNFCVGLLLVKFLNVVGISIAFFLSFIVGTAVSYYIQKKLSEVEIDWRSLLYTLLFSAISSIVIILLQISYYNLYIYLIYLIIGVGVYLFLLFNKFVEEIKELTQQLPFYKMC